MTAANHQLPASVAPMPARKRFGISTAASVGLHLLLLVLIGLLSGRTAVRPEVLIPIELTMAEGYSDSLVLGGGGLPEAPPKTAEAPSASDQPSKEQPSSMGGKAKAAPAPPKLLTSKSGTEPAGPEGMGAEPAGPGGQEEKPAGPTRGPNIIGGPKPIYPKDALDRRLEGSVILTVNLAADGTISSIAVAKSSGHELLDRAARAAVERHWTFEPALDKGEPVAGKQTITFVFSPGSDQEPPSVKAQ